MQSTITVRAWGATALGLLFAGITARVLLDDVVHGAPVTVSHMLSVGALVATLAAGHYFLPALKRAAIFSATGLAILFLAGTAYVLVASATRNAETAATKAAGVRQTNEQRAAMTSQLATAQEDLERSKADLAKATAEAAVECGSGKGKRCDGREATRAAAERARDRAESHVAILQARISLLGPVRDEAGGYAHAGRVWATLVGGSAEQATTALQLAMPIVTTLLCELGTIVFLSIGLGHRAPRRGEQPAPLPAKPAPAPTSQHEAVVSFVQQYQARHGRPPRWMEVRQAGFSRATASRGLRMAVPS
jgi:hypothetical protein